MRQLKLPMQEPPAPTMWPPDSSWIKREPGPYGVGPIVDLPRDRLGDLKRADRPTAYEKIVLGPKP